MNKLVNWLSQSFAPRMHKINNNVWILAIKDSIMQVLPLIFLGSLFCLCAILNNYISWLPNFWTPYNWTFGLVSIFIAFLIPFNIMEKKKKRKSRINAGIAGEILFFMAINPQFILDQESALGTGTSAFSAFTSIGGLGAGGMFMAIIAGIFVAAIVNLLSNFSFFSEESIIPDFVRAWFDSMLPIGLITIIGWILTDASMLNLNLYQIVVNIFMPLQNFAQTPYGMIFILFIYCFFYSMGISTWVLNPVTKPILVSAAAANVALAAAGTATNQTLNLYTDASVYSAYMWIGGIGCTFSLALMMLLLSKSKQLKALGTACIGPVVFNINEPLVFGAVAWNPIMMLPMWIQGIIIPLVTYIFTKVIPLAPIPNMLFDMWYAPYPIATWLTTRSVMGLLLMVVNFIISWFIWMPFFKVYDKELCDKEKAEELEAKAV